MKKKILIYLSVVAMGMFILSPEAGAVRYYSFGTGSTAGTFYIVGAGFSNHVNKYYPEVRLTPECTAGGDENLNLVKRKKLDITLLNSYSLMRELLKGDPLIKENYRQVTWADHTSDFHFIVRKDSPIKDFCDCKGKKFAVGPHGSAMVPLTLDFLRVLCGYVPDKDFKALYYTFAEGQTGIRDNTVDIAMTGAGFPVASVIELASMVPIRLIEFSDEQLEKVFEAQPALIDRTIPAGTYKGVDYDVKAISQVIGIGCHKDIPEKDMYGIMKALYSHVEERNIYHPQIKYYTIEPIIKVGVKFTKRGIPFHSGVVKYLKEIGAWKPELEVK